MQSGTTDPTDMYQKNTLGILATLGCSLLASQAELKTEYPQQLTEEQLKEAPYRHNGVVISGETRGSGFSAWNPQTFFTAAHVLYAEEGWSPAPLYYPGSHSQDLDDTRKIKSRGYVRFKSYASLTDEENQPAAFGKDIALCYSFNDVNGGKTAQLDQEGGRKLREGARYLVTGYPAENAYLEEEIEGYFMHRTGPFNNPFSTYSDQALTTTLISTGPGNSGGPVWIRNQRGNWVTAGILVGGLPSESIIYAFSEKINPLLSAVSPLVQSPSGKSVAADGVGNSSFFFPFRDRRVIPDGVLNWSNFRVEAGIFGRGTTLTKVKLALNIQTPHRGDLQVMLSAPDGTNYLLHNENGADGNNLIYRNKNLTKHFEGIDPYGAWILRVQDRLKGDTSVLKSFRLELEVDETTEEEPATNPQP